MGRITRGNRISSIFLILPVFLICSASCSVNAENVSGLNNSTNATNQTWLLIDGEGQVLANGEQREFYQGYAICIKGVGSRGNQAWIELLQNGTTVNYGIFEAGDHFTYKKDDEIFNVTIDHIYIGSQKDMVFFYVYQYLDPDLPAPVPGLPFNTTSPSNTTSGDGSASANTTDTTTAAANTTSATHGNSSDSVPGYGRCIAIGALVSAYIVSRHFHR
ncbi:MAG: hypothetical protein KAR25_02840 [Methanosarcinales archaeon]|nr:hypothetical protein [Methanosarcinales archaeon]